MKKIVKKAIASVTKKLSDKQSNKEKDMKKAIKREAVTETKKTMKREPVVTTKLEFGSVRKLFNQILSKNKGLTLVENKHGAIQVKRSGDLLFSARSDGKMIITHPIFEGKGKDKTRFFKHMGSGWDHLSNIPFENVTLSILQARVDDSRTTKEYRNDFYGKHPEESGLFKKSQAALARVSKVVAEEKGKKGKEIKVLKKGKEIKREAVRTPVKASKTVVKAVRQVALARV